jgi:sensor histidine kinase YesM
MNLFKLFFLAAIIGNCSLYGAKQWEQFLRATQAFESGDIQLALQEYQEISDKGPIVFYNIALCHKRLNNPFDALVAFKQAQKQADLKLFNLVTAQIEQLENHFEKSHDTTFFAYAKWWRAFFSLFLVQLVFLCSWWAFLIALYWVNSTYKKFIQLFLLLLLIMSGSIGFSLLYLKHADNGLIKETASVFVGPDSSFNTLTTLMQADQIQIHSLQDEWYKVQYDNKVGWIEASKVIKID